MKKISSLVLAMVIVLGLSAQTTKGTMSLGTNLPLGGFSTGAPSFGFSMNDGNMAFGLNLEGGYFLVDNLMLKGQLGVGYQKPDGGDGTTSFDFACGAKYYFEYLLPLAAGASFNYTKVGDFSNTGLMLDAAYVWFYKQNISVEPGLFYNLPFTDGVKSTFGLKAGINIFF